MPLYKQLSCVLICDIYSKYLFELCLILQVIQNGSIVTTNGLEVMEHRCNLTAFVLPN